MTGGGGDRPDLVVGFTAVDSWDAAVGRHLAMPLDRLVARALGHPDLGRVLVADPFRSAPALAVRRLLGQRAPFEATDRGHDLVSPARLRRRDPVDPAGIARTYARYDRHLERAATRLGLRRPAVITANPFVAAHAALRWAGPVTYYAWDDWAGYPPHRPWWPAYEAAYTAIRGSGRAVCAVSSTLLERIAPAGPGVVVANGIEASLWGEPGAAPAWVAALPRPILLYIGTIDSRIDAEALAAVAAAVPNGTVLVVGLVTEPDVLLPLDLLPNVVRHPLVGHTEMPAIVAAADVGIVPHRRTRLTESMSPLKLYEFLAGGLPVVATDLTPMRDVDPRVVLADSAPAFGSAVTEALALGRAPEADRRAFVDANSWEHRTDQILAFALRDPAAVEPAG